MTGPVLDIRVTLHGSITVLKPIGWLSATTRPELDSRFRAATDGGGFRIVVDLSSVHFSDNSTLATFAYWRSALNSRGGCLVLASPNGKALRALKTGQLDKYLPICDSVAEALDLAKQKTESGRWAPITA